MSTTYTKRDARTPVGTGHGWREFDPSPSFDTYTGNRWYTVFDLTSFVSGNFNIEGITADGTVFRSTRVLSGDPDLPTNP